MKNVIQKKKANNKRDMWEKVTVGSKVNIKIFQGGKVMRNLASNCKEFAFILDE